LVEVHLVELHLAGQRGQNGADDGLTLVVHSGKGDDGVYRVGERRDESRGREPNKAVVMNHREDVHRVGVDLAGQRGRGGDLQVLHAVSQGIRSGRENIGER
jgi:hypothetical protein